MSNTSSKRICKKCLLYEFSNGDYFAHLYEYIENLDEDIKVDDEEYERRLNLCISCPEYFEGMCRVCGCFVELRAVIRENECADVMRHW